MNALPAAAGMFWGYTFGEVAIALVVIAAILGILFYALHEFGVAVPPFFVKCLWIVLVAVIAILAIRFLMSL